MTNDSHIAADPIPAKAEDKQFDRKAPLVDYPGSPEDRYDAMEKQFLKSKKLRVLINGIHAKSGGGITYLQNILPLLAEDPDLELHLFLHPDQYGFISILWITIAVSSVRCTGSRHPCPSSHGRCRQM